MKLSEVLDKTDTDRKGELPSRKSCAGMLSG